MRHRFLLIKDIFEDFWFQDGPEKVLTIDDVDDGDQGVYVCKADNAQGTIQTSATLQVFQGKLKTTKKYSFWCNIKNIQHR